MKVGVTTLKKVCRLHGIKRWPYRRRSFIHKLTQQAMAKQHGRQAELTAERVRNASCSLGPAAPQLPVSHCTSGQEYGHAQALASGCHYYWCVQCVLLTGPCRAPTAGELLHCRTESWAAWWHRSSNALGVPPCRAASSLHPGPAVSQAYCSAGSCLHQSACTCTHQLACHATTSAVHACLRCIESRLALHAQLAVLLGASHQLDHIASGCGTCQQWPSCAHA